MILFNHNVSLKPFNTFRIDALATELATVHDNDEAQSLAACSSPDNTVVIGGGSNILLLSDVYNCRMVRVGIDLIQQILDDDDHVVFRVGAGVVWDDLVNMSVNKGLYGIENLSGIPGTVGAAPIQNIGAFGHEAASAIQSVEGFYFGSGKPFSIDADKCNFGYRNSIFKNELKSKVMITNVTFKFNKQGKLNLDYGALKSAPELQKSNPSLSDVRQAVLSIRNSKLPDPDVLGNAGSFFKNPFISQEQADYLNNTFEKVPIFVQKDGNIKVAAGWLIEQCGWKGKSLGPAAVHDKQALVLVNKGGAKGQDIVNLCDAIRKDVMKKFNIGISPEVNFIK